MAAEETPQTPVTPETPAAARRRLRPTQPRSLNSLEENAVVIDTLPPAADEPAMRSQEDAAKSVAQQEQEHLSNAQSSPLALTFQLVGCAFANPVWEKDPQTGEEPVIPTRYDFHPPCIRGYAQPNQECRTCAYVRLMPVGERTAFQHRYHGHGMIIPINEAQAEAIYTAATGAGAAPLGNPLWNSYFAELEAKAKAQREAEERARQVEEQQRGSFARRTNGQPGQL